MSNGGAPVSEALTWRGGPREPGPAVLRAEGIPCVELESGYDS